jgi:hypothetical protein
VQSLPPAHVRAGEREIRERGGRRRVVRERMRCGTYMLVDPTIFFNDKWAHIYFFILMPHKRHVNVKWDKDQVNIATCGATSAKPSSKTIKISGMAVE